VLGGGFFGDFADFPFSEIFPNNKRPFRLPLSVSTPLDSSCCELLNAQKLI